MSLLCVAQHANVQLACCSNLNLKTILRLRVDSSFDVPAEKMKESNNEEATEAASRSRKRHLVLRLVNVLMISLIGAL